MAKDVTITPGAARANAPIQLKATDKNLTVETLDQNGKNMPDVTADKVSVTMKPDDPTAVTVTPGADSQHWTFTIPANSAKPFTLDIVETYLDNSFGPFEDLQPFLPPSPPPSTPTTIQVVVS